MRRTVLKYGVVLLVFFVTGGCKGLTGPDRTGEIDLSSETFGETYYLFGFSYEHSEFYRFQYQGETRPDIINEGYRVLIGGEVSTLPGFNTPGQMNGFALAGEFGTLEEARNFYEGYTEVEGGMQFETVSDTVELFQVWVQQTELGNYVKLLIKEIQNFEGETGAPFNKVTMDYTYQPDGSTTFPK